MSLRSLANGRMFAEVQGEGTPVIVLLHGWGRDRKDLVGAAANVVGTKVFIDLPGFGSSPEPPSAWGAHDYATLTGEGIAELTQTFAQAHHVVVVGHSFGGRVGVCLAAQPGCPVAGLVLTGVPLLRRASSRGSRMFRLMRSLNRSGLVSDQRMESMRQRHGSADYRAARGVMRESLVRLVGESYEAELSKVECPTRFVWGALDTAAPLDMARQASRFLPQPPSFLVVEGAGHDLHRERPDLLGGEIERLASQL